MIYIVGGLVFGFRGITTGGLFGSIVMATIGAVILLYLINAFKKIQDADRPLKVGSVRLSGKLN